MFVRQPDGCLTFFEGYMDYSWCLKGNKLDQNKLTSYGFINNTYRIELSDEFDLMIDVNKGIEAHLYDGISNEVYAPVDHLDYFGSYVSELREKVEVKILEIIEECKEEVQLHDQLLHYVKEKYEVEPDYTFSDLATPVLRAKNNKWFGIFLWVDKLKLGIQEKGQCLVLNVKCKYVSIVDNEFIFKAYHMNKKYWVSVLIDHKTSFELVTRLMDESYNLVIKKR